MACLVALLCFAENAAMATWSVVAVDRSTGRVVISSSTCTGTTDDFLKNVQAVVVPGKGVAACQAGVDSATHQNQTLVFEELKRGTDPARIIEMLSEDPGFQSRQYGIVDLEGRAAGHSGLANGFVSQDIHGQVPGTEIFYSIQGNGEGVPGREGRHYGSCDGGDGGGRRGGRGQPLHLPDARGSGGKRGHSVHPPHVAGGLHPGGRSGR
jgi:hypothetical protein